MRKHNELVAQLTANMIEHADENWREYAQDGWYVSIFGTAEMEKAYQRLYGEEMPNTYFWDIVNDPRIEKAAECMERIVRDHIRENEVDQVIYPATMTEKMRERGLSIRDFVEV